MALLLLVAVRFIYSVRNLDSLALGFLVAIGFGFVVGDLNHVAFLFAVINQDGFGGRKFNLNALFNLDGVRLLDSVGYINKNAVGNLDINTNSLRAGNLGGYLTGDIFANRLRDLCTD